MLDLTQYDSLGAALRDALGRWPEEVCLIEADRDHERSRLTYRQFGEAAEPVAAALEESGFAAGDRAAIIMTNQSKWLISAYAVFFAGGVLVPLDYKLSAAEHLAVAGALESAGSVCRIPAVARDHAGARISRTQTANGAGDRSAAERRSRGRRCAGRNFAARARPNSGRASANGHGLHRLFLRHGRPPQGLRADARQLSRTVRRGDAGFSVLARRALLEHHSHQSCDRFHGRLHHAVHRRRRPSFICARCGRNLSAKLSRNTRSPTWPWCR